MAATVWALFGIIVWWVVSMGIYIGTPKNFIVGGAIVGFFIGMFAIKDKD